MRNLKSVLFLLCLLISNKIFIQSLQAADLKISGEYRLNGYLYNESDRTRGPFYERSSYFLQQAVLNTDFHEGITSGVIQFYLNNLTNGDQNTGGNIWGTNGPYSSKLQTGPLIHQAYLNIHFPVGELYAGRRLIKLGHGIILNDTSDNLTFHLPISVWEVDVAYLKLSEPDSSRFGTAGDYDRSGKLARLNLKLGETDSLEFFYVKEDQRATGLMAADTDVLALGVSGSVRMIGIDWSGEYDLLSGHDGDLGVNLPRAGNNLLISGSTQVSFGRLGLEVIRIKGKALGEKSYNSLAGDFAGGNGILLNDQTRFGGGIDLNSRMADMADPSGYLRLLSHNFQLVKGSVVFNPLKKLILSVEFFPFVTVIDRGALGLTNEKIGTEANLTGTYPIGDSLKMSGGIAYFKAGDVLQEIAVKTGIPSVASNVIKSYLSLLYSF